MELIWIELSHSIWLLKNKQSDTDQSCEAKALHYLQTSVDNFNEYSTFYLELVSKLSPAPLQQANTFPYGPRTRLISIYYYMMLLVATKR